MILFAQVMSIALMAGWITLGVRDNLLFPKVNEELTAQVMAMHRMEAEWPESFAYVAHRKVQSRRVQLAAFRLIVIAELCCAILLWLACAALAYGFVAPELIWAKPLAVFASLWFMTIWGMFTVVGQHFSYWFGHEGAKNTHFQLLLWGLGNLIFLAVA